MRTSSVGAPLSYSVSADIVLPPASGNREASLVLAGTCGQGPRSQRIGPPVPRWVTSAPVVPASRPRPAGARTRDLGPWGRAVAGVGPRRGDVRHGQPGGAPALGRWLTSSAARCRVAH